MGIIENIKQTTRNIFRQHNIRKEYNKFIRTIKIDRKKEWPYEMAIFEGKEETHMIISKRLKKDNSIKIWIAILKQDKIKQYVRTPGTLSEQRYEVMIKELEKRFGIPKRQTWNKAWDIINRTDI